jgi:hypothetical protein|tara:strand:+ start:362 stop:865 length:504 start_codon:yes stop_codon:yes gene_type:complete
MFQLNNKDLILFIIISLIEYLCVYIGFNNHSNILFAKIILILFIIFTIKRFNIYLILLNCFYILSLIIFFYKICNYKDNEDNIENFTNKLKDFKEKEKFKMVSSNLNSTNLREKNMKKKEKFRENDHISFNEYKDDFKSYRFTRKTKSTSDALNKIPFYIEKFKELW